jgi:hypothetical protein
MFFNQLFTHTHNNITYVSWVKAKCISIIYLFLVQISLDGAWGTKDKYILNCNFQKKIPGNKVALMKIA